MQPGAGHYGVFNGTRFRTEIQPRIREMIRTIQFKRGTGGGSNAKIPPPSRSLTETRERQFDWRHDPAAAGSG